MLKFKPHGMGWQRDAPDLRDYTVDHHAVRKLLESIKSKKSRRRKLPEGVDLREYFSEVEDQGPLKASSTFAVLAVVEYFEARAHGHIVEPSKLFLYRVSLQSQGTTHDVGASLRTTLKALVRCGTPPENHWPYEPERLSEVPIEPFLASFARDYASICYVRLDKNTATGLETLLRVKSFLAAGFPSAFGFTVPSFLFSEPDVAFRPDTDGVRGGQAVVAVGYDDTRRIGSQTGALLIRSSWGTGWGDEGYGWLPFAFVENHLAVDFWTLFRDDWLQSEEFQRPTVLEDSKGPIARSRKP